MNIVLIGAGHWGQAYIKTFTRDFPHVKLDIGTRQNWQKLVDQKPNGVIVCTPPNVHVEQALHALQQDIPVMIEKPLALSLKECEKLNGFKTPILVNHIHLFSEGYIQMKRVLGDHWTNKIDKIETAGWGTNQHEYSQLWDYGVHDLSMILDLMGQNPISVKCYKTNHYHVMMDFGNKHQTHTVSLIGKNTKWKDIGLEKMRKIAIHFSGLSLEYDDINRPSHHIPPLTNAIKTFLNVVEGMEDDRLGIDLL